MDRYAEFCGRKRREYGDRFDPSGLASEFIPAFNSGERVRVAFSYGEEANGTIGVTAGWRPVFLLMRRRNATGSSDVLHANDHIIVSES